MIPGGYSEGASRPAGERSACPARAAAQGGADAPRRNERSREGAEQRMAQRGMGAEREQRALEIFGQRAARADQAQAEADLGVQVVVHALGVFALTHESCRVELEFDAQAGV